MQEIALGLGALGVIALCVSFAWWLARWAKEATARGDLVAERKRQLDIHLEELRASIAERDRVIDQIKSALARETAARKAVEETLDHAIQEMSSVGNLGGVAAGIRAQLAKLRELQTSVPGVPASSSKDRGGKGSMHGTSEDPT